MRSTSHTQAPWSFVHYYHFVALVWSCWQLERVMQMVHEYFIQITEIKNLWDSESLPLWTSSPTKTKENNTFPGTSFFPSTMFMGPSRTPHKEEGGQWEIDFLTAVFLFRGRRSSKTDCRWGELPGLCFCISIKEFWGPLKSIRRWGNKDRRSARSHG